MDHGRPGKAHLPPTDARMARAMQLGVEAGRLAYLSGRIPKKLYATASSPTEGTIAAKK